MTRHQRPPVHLARGCRWLDERGGHEVRVRVGPLVAPGLATRLLVTEEVTDKPGLEPYADAAAARADLARLDHLPALLGTFGDHGRLCDLRDGDGGFGSGWFLACSPETALHRLATPCTGDIPCTTIGIADPSLPSVDTHRNLKSFGHVAREDAP